MNLYFISGHLFSYDEKENEFSTIEVYVYEESTNNLFVHHEITLSAFPLALEWLSINPNTVIEDTASKGTYFCSPYFFKRLLPFFYRKFFDRGNVLT
jgi:hypothetical protein